MMKKLTSFFISKGVIPIILSNGNNIIGQSQTSKKANIELEAGKLRPENKALKKEFNRKDKALAETAALLVLQKSPRDLG